MNPLYTRHFALKEFDQKQQDILASSTVGIIGCGGLGNLTTMYLTTAGIGKLIINDFDSVDITNLQRQILFKSTDIGKNKALIAKQHLKLINPETNIETIEHRLSPTELQTSFKNCSLIIDCSDNFATRYSVNEVSQKLKIPLLTGAAIRFQGQLSIFNPNIDDSPCYQCLYPDQDESIEDCEGNGILAPVTGVIASQLAVEAIKYLSQIGTTPVGRLLLYDAKNSNWREIKIAKRLDCPICANE